MTSQEAQIDHAMIDLGADACSGCGADLAAAGGMAVWNDLGRFCPDCEASGAAYRLPQEGPVQAAAPAALLLDGVGESSDTTPRINEQPCARTGCTGLVPVVRRRGRPQRWCSDACRMWVKRHAARAQGAKA